MRILRHLVPVTVLTIAVSLVDVTTSDAGRRGYSHNDQYVAAESKFGNGSVVGPVRRTSVGWQVRTPGGSWLHCARSCSETLRVNTVDFWENQGQHRGNAIDQEDGLLSKWLSWPRRY